MRLASRDFLSGILFVTLGLGVAALSAGYRMGQLNAMGPGFFPFWLGITLAIFGTVVTVGAVVAPNRYEAAADDRVELPHRYSLRALGLVVGSIVAFGLALEPLGIGGAVAVVVVVSSLASSRFSLVGTLVSAAVLTALSIGLFVYGLGLPLPVVPFFAGG